MMICLPMSHSSLETEPAKLRRRSHSTKEKVPKDLFCINISIIVAIVSMSGMSRRASFINGLIRPNNIVLSPTLFIAKTLKSFRYSLESFLSTWCFVLIRMNLQRELSIRLSNILDTATLL
ncbi:hypothetical protein PanWU01x14_019780 [Parasponia andersonii]|uniref:Uncharacterized protein n=1 Tax=Parasponia andersonii TaxID=3476 RepID=A0A2P5DYK1_PARAD|nr:hypothetical protein PanWU01x14_019780 [Parasponia andersonii]